MKNKRAVGRWRVPLTLAAILGCVATAWVPGPLARATPAGPRAVGGYPGEVMTTTLADTSIGAPGFWSTTTGTVRSVIAWTGTDAERHLNVMTSGIGTAYGTKKTLPETSFVGPAVTRTSDGKVVIAWTGTDTKHSLNILYDVYGSPLKRTLSDTSFTTPGLAVLDGQLVLAWAGTDANRTLNAWTFSTPGLTPIRKVTLPAQYNTDAAPDLSFDPLGASLGRNRLILSWTARAPSYRITFATSSDAASWSAPASLPETSVSGASMIGIPQSFASYMPGHYVAWTGTDAARSVNVQYTDNFYHAPPWPNPTASKATLNQMALNAARLGFIGGPKQVMVVWTGTDAAHHLNVALVAISNPGVGVPGFSPRSGDTSVVYQGDPNQRQVTLTFDAGGDFGPQTTKILDVLERRGVPSTWFVEAAWAQQHPDIVRRARNDGIGIGNHTVDHPHFPKSPAVSSNFIYAELTLGDQIISDVAGAGSPSTLPYFRPPFGELGPVYTFNPVTSQVSNAAAVLGYRTILYTVDPRDWETTITTQQVLDRVLNSSKLQNGAIILLHAGGAHTGDALDQLITGLQNKGYKLVALPQVLGS